MPRCRAIWHTVIPLAMAFPASRGPEECWAMDFAHDSLADGRYIRILSVIDLWDRRGPVLTVGFSQIGQGVVNVLNDLKAHGLLPRTLRTDNGPEFTCEAVKAWSEKMVWQSITPGKAVQPTTSASRSSMEDYGMSASISIFSQIWRKRAKRLKHGGWIIMKSDRMGLACDSRL